MDRSVMAIRGATRNMKYVSTLETARELLQPTPKTCSRKKGDSRSPSIFVVFFSQLLSINESIDFRSEQCEHVL